MREFEEHLAQQEQDLNQKAVDLQKQRDELERQQEQLNAQKIELQQVSNGTNITWNILMQTRLAVNEKTVYIQTWCCRLTLISVQENTVFVL